MSIPCSFRVFYSISILILILGCNDTTKKDKSKILVLPSNATKAQLLQILSDEQQNIYLRYTAVKRLGISGDKTIVPLLIKHLGRKPDRLLLEVIIALENLGDERALLPLIELRRHHGAFPGILTVALQRAIEKLESSTPVPLYRSRLSDK